MTEAKQLVSIYKKNGSFDKQRKKLLENFKASQTHTNLKLKLKLIVDSKVKSDPSILMKNRGKIGALIQGNIIQQKNETENSILSIVDKDIQEKIIDSPDFHRLLKDELKDIERVVMGISDEEWAETKRKEAEEVTEEARKGFQNDELDRTASAPSAVDSSAMNQLEKAAPFVYKPKPAKVVKAPIINLKY